MAETDIDPALIGMTDAEQVPAANMHPPLGVKVTDPVGMVAPVVEVSVTTAAHVDDWPTTTLVGLHAMVVVVGCDAARVTCMLKVFRLLSSNESPLYEAVIVSNRAVVPVGV